MGKGMHGKAATGHGHQTTGAVLEGGWRYDAEVWLMDRLVLRGRLRRLRARVLELAGIGPDRRLLDVGCGTGTLAIEAARSAGSGGRIAGVDPSASQIARAKAKAARSRTDVEFRTGVIESLPFGDGSFDSVTSTLMLHHLPGDLKRQGLDEIYRVLGAGGRVVLADFDSAGGSPDGEDMASLVAEAGFVGVSSERTRFPRTHRNWTGATVISASRP